MAKKKVAKKATSKKSSVKEQEQLTFSFKDIKKEMSLTEQREVHQHNLGQLYSFSNLLAGATKITDTDSKIASVVNKMLLIDRKIVLICSEINKLSQLIEEAQKETQPTSKTEISM